MEGFVISGGKFDRQNFTIENNIAIILGSSEEEKTLLLSNIAKGFNGRLGDSFLYENRKVLPGEYQVVYLNDAFDLSEQIKMTKSNPLRDEILKFVSVSFIGDGNDSLTPKLEEIGDSLNTIINNFFKRNTNEIVNNLDFRAELELKSLETIIDKFLKITINDINIGVDLNPDKINKFVIRMLIFRLLHLYIDWNDQLRNVIFVLDLPFMGADIKHSLKLANYIKKLSEKGAKIILSVNNPDIFELFESNIKQLNYVQSGVNKYANNLKSVIRNSVCFNAFLESNEKDLILYKDDFMKVFSDVDLEIETQYFNKYCMLYLTRALFAKTIYLRKDANNTSSFSLIEEELKFEYSGQQKNLIFIYFMLLNFKDKNQIELDKNLSISDIAD